MKSKKILIAIAITVALVFAIWYSFRFFRLEIIRASLEWDLPWWLQALIWGW